jgi:hypothetical protein
MSVVAYVHSSAPLTSLTASSDSSDGGPSLIIIALIAIVVIWVLSLGSTASTVVVVEKPAGSFLGFALIALALGILYFVYIAPATGQT